MKKLFLMIAGFLAISVSTFAQTADVTAISKTVTDELNLTPAQAAEVKKIYQAAGDKIANVFNSTQPNNQKATQVNAIIADMDTKSKAAIPAEKRAQYDAIVARLRNKKPGQAAPAAAQNGTSKETLKATFKSQLGVTDAVAEELAEMTINDGIKKKEIQQQYKSDPQTKAKLIKEVNMDAKAKIDALLTTEQKNKLTQILLQQK
jgi:hypothetical protein